ncbi:SMP-30/gluconolactonase/LRE family protein [Achromobacter sp. LC458]|uniref:SMP-30/gluconolactonase/LRE family protein n=1 Tax=Achromobacter sp. LC458 TaxID=1120623 RepID=UPI00062A48BE|nr:SMP-30/gluconolactonase/LRE family protein [Achromobacter sp. LC458]TRM49405.1 SMP-30/gluconolactonase/LRE family protein [Achromobacter sp. LC458]
MQIERIGTVRAALGECPVWDAAENCLWMLDCRSGQLLRIDPENGATREWRLPAPVGSFALNGGASIIVALKETFALVSLNDGATRTLGRIDDSHPNLRLNDGAPLPDGSFVAGTMHVHRQEGEAPLGGLYRVDTGGRVSRIAQGLGVVNGPVMHPDGRHFHVCDSAQRKGFRYRMEEAGRLSSPEVFIDTDALGSAPDGCCFDREGGLWTALVHAAAIARFDAAGKLDRRIDLPVAHPASLCFGGPDLSDIFVTTISDSGRLTATGPLDGALLRVRGAGAVGAPRGQCRIRP